MTLSFTERISQAARKIPRGRVATYVQVARRAGFPRAARAGGNALKKSPGMPLVPCHRVVCSDGRVGGFARGTRVKIKMLKREGIEVRNGKVDLKKFGWPQQNKKSGT